MKASTCAMVLGLTALAVNTTNADVAKPLPKPGGGGVVPNIQRIQQTAPYLDLVNLTVVRQGVSIRVEGLVKYGGFSLVANPPAASGNWTLYRSDNGKWVRLTGSGLALAAGKQTTVGGTFDGKGGTWFKLEVRSNGSGKLETLTKQAPAQVFAVQYRRTEWSFPMWFTQIDPRNELIGAKAREHAKALNALGFETTIKYITTKHEYIVNGWTEYKQEVKFRAVNWQERPFNTEAAARSFMNRLPGGCERNIVIR